MPNFSPKLKKNKIYIIVKGAGGPDGQIAFFVVFDWEDYSYQQFFFRDEKILFQAKVIVSWNLENTYNYIAPV